jgi:hypothetical protein
MAQDLLTSSNRNAPGGFASLLRSADCEVFDLSRVSGDVRASHDARPDGTLIVQVALSREVVEQLRRCGRSRVRLVVDGPSHATKITKGRSAARDERQLATARNAARTMPRVVKSASDNADAHSLMRWAEPIVRVIGTQSDPRTLSEWGRCVGVSSGALSNWCRTARLPAHRSLRFARVLRAVVRQQVSGSRPEDLLNIVDRRTLAKLLLASGGQLMQLPPTVEDFLSRQRLIDSAEAVEQVRGALERMGIALTARHASMCEPRDTA